MKIGKKIIILAMLVFVFMPVFAHAAPSWWPIVPCGTSVNPAPCTRCDLFKLVSNVIDFVLIGLMPPVATILFVWAGFLVLMGGANPGWISQGKQIFWTTFMGILILLASWLITNSIIQSVADPLKVPGNWWEFTCQGTTGTQTPPPVATLSIITVSLPDGVLGKDYSELIQASGGTTPYVWSITAGALPAGLSLSQNFGITGIPTVAGTSNFTVQVQDSSNPKKTATKQLSIKVVGGAVLTIITTSLPDAIEGKNYSEFIQASGGTNPLIWSLDSGSLPPGLSLSQNFGITGTPTTPGTYTFTVKVTDSSTTPQSAVKQLTIKVVAVSQGVIISGVASSNITNNSATITWTTDKPSTSQVEYGTTTAYGSATTVNSSLATSHSATISGLTPGTTYNYRAVSSITGFTAKSSNNTFRTTGTTTTPVSITTTSLLGATQNKSYSQTLVATGGTSPYFWSISGGSLPTGLSLSNSGTIGGIPTATGVSTFTLRVADSSNPQQSATKQLSITVAGQSSGGTCTGVQCSDSGINVCGPVATNCADSGVNQWNAQILAAASKNQIGSGINTISLVKAIMSQESGGRPGLTSYDGSSFGLMQMQPPTANIYKRGCTTDNVTSSWLLDSNNAEANICIAINYIKSLFGPCGTEVRNIAAGYNGGGAAKGACAASTSCKSCSICAGQTTRRWECPWDGPDGEHLSCNVDRRDPTTGQLDNFGQTRVYAPHVAYCYSHF